VAGDSAAAAYLTGRSHRVDDYGGQDGAPNANAVVVGEVSSTSETAVSVVWAGRPDRFSADVVYGRYARADSIGALVLCRIGPSPRRSAEFGRTGGIPVCTAQFRTLGA
jgi:hypothetical protein